MHPYEMIRLLRLRHDDRLVPVTNGTVYHTVGRLQKLGLLAEQGSIAKVARPRAHHLHRVTEAGRNMVPEWVRAELPRIDRPEQFQWRCPRPTTCRPTRWSTCCNGSRPSALAVLQHGLTKAEARGVPDFYLIETREATLLAADHQWLTDIIAAIEQRSLDWNVHALDDTSDRYLAQRKAARQ